MCTCIAYKNKDFYFGRNLDLDCSFREQVVVTPRNFSLEFRNTEWEKRHYAMIGMASADDRFPLYAEAVNEKGLCMAGLNFPGNAYYQKAAGAGLELASFEVIPWLLGKCSSVSEAAGYLEEMRIVDTAFAQEMPPAPLHWMLADREKCLVLEAVREGLKVYDNPIGVLTNNPPFPFHQMNLNRYQGLSPLPAENHFCSAAPLEVFGQGMGAIGLPGDASPTSRYVKAAFHKLNSQEGATEEERISQFFHLLDSVSMVRGSVVTAEGRCDITTYSCCASAEKGIYYYKTYENSRISAVRLFGENPDTQELKIFPLCKEQDIRFQN